MLDNTSMKPLQPNTVLQPHVTTTIGRKTAFFFKRMY